MKLFHPDTIEKFATLGRLLLLPTVVERERDGRFPLDLWRKLGEEGLFKVCSPDVVRELRHGRVSSALYGLASGSLDLPYCSSVAAHIAVASDLLWEFGSRAQVRRYEPEIVSGTRIGAICNSEAGAGCNLKLMRSRMEPSRDGRVLLQADKPCSTNLSVAGLAITSFLDPEGKIRIYLLEEGEFSQWPVQSEFFSFRTGAIGSLEAAGIEVNAEERELQNGMAVLRHCLHTERFCLGVTTAGLLAGLEKETHAMLLPRVTTAERQYLQDKLVHIRTVRITIESVLERIFALTGGGETWEKAATELAVLKLLVNQDAPSAARAAYESMGFGAVRLASNAQRVLRDLSVMAYFGGTSELQKLQVFQGLAKESGTKLKKSA